MLVRVHAQHSVGVYTSALGHVWQRCSFPELAAYSSCASTLVLECHG